MKKFIAIILGTISLAAMAETKETIFSNEDWIAVKSVDPMSDKVECYIWGNKKPYYQVSYQSMYVVYRGRGGLTGPGYRSVGSLVKFRYDDEPASDYIQATELEGKLNALIIPIRNVMNKSRLRIQTGTLVGGVVVDDINLTTLQPAIEACTPHW